MRISDAHWQQMVEAFGMGDATGAAFGLTAEETAAHRQAFRDAATMGGDAFLAAVAREQLSFRNDNLSVAERLRLEARRNVAAVIEDYFTREALEGYDGPKH